MTFKFGVTTLAVRLKSEAGLFLRINDLGIKFVCLIEGLSRFLNLIQTKHLKAAKPGNIVFIPGLASFRKIDVLT